VALRGTFRETNPEDLLQILALGGKTGVLTATDGPRATKLIFRDGEIFDAFDGVHRGEAAVWALLAGRSGTFVFASGEVVCERTIQRTVPAILLEAARRRDEQGPTCETRWRAETRPCRLREGAADAPEAMADRQRQVLELVDGRRTVRELADAARMSPEEMDRMLVALEVMGHLAPPRTEAEPLPSEDGEAVCATSLAPSAGRGPDAPARAEDLREIAQFVRRAAHPLPQEESSP
jgi:hypothetical protein